VLHTNQSIRHRQHLSIGIYPYDLNFEQSVHWKHLKLLFNGNNKVFCVGDDDQSIYGWRGAKIEIGTLKIVSISENFIYKCI
jgi:hypothetical protein